jgi:hypothetical protein
MKMPGETSNLSPMDLLRLTDLNVRGAIAALQAGNKMKWLAFFSADAKMTDDGSPRSFTEFSDDALGHERFTSIDRVENNGLDVYVLFHSNRWGDFKTYFKFHPGSDEKFTRLDIGQQQ